MTTPEQKTPVDPNCAVDQERTATVDEAMARREALDMSLRLAIAKRAAFLNS